MQNHLLIIGAGYTGLQLALQLAQKDWKISVTTTSTQENIDADFLKNMPKSFKVYTTANAVLPDACKEELLGSVTHILSSVPPSFQTGKDPILENNFSTLERAADQGRVMWAGYLSTTSVYGDHQGGWVDEFTEVNPNLSRGKARLDSEKGWISTGLPMHVFRLPEIYGPDENELEIPSSASNDDNSKKSSQSKSGDARTRNQLSRVRLGLAKIIIKPNQYFSRIFVDDLVSALIASMTSYPRPGRIYNVCDDYPCTTEEVVRYACGLLNASVPTPVEFDAIKSTMSPMQLSFYAESKKVSNKLIKEELGWAPKFPTYKEGLQDLLSNPRLYKSPFKKPEKKEEKKAEKKEEEVTSNIIISTLHKISCACKANLLKAYVLIMHYLKSIISLLRLLFAPKIKKNLYVYVMDNGSVRPEPTINLRVVSKFLGLALSSNPQLATKFESINVLPVSARYADRIPSSDLNGEGAIILKSALENVKSNLKPGESTKILILPYFLGPSATITEFAPGQLKDFFPPNHQSVSWGIAKPLIDLETNDPIANLLAENIRRTAKEKIPHLKKYSVVLCEHGSPLFSVNRVRRNLASKLRRILKDEALCIADCAMESREGDQFFFNRPLLEEVFARFGKDEEVILALAFLSDGKHAGEDGDISNILKSMVLTSRPDLKIHNTGSLLTQSDNINKDHPLIQHLQERTLEAL